MAMTNYRNNWLRIGFTETDLADGGSDKFIDAMVLWGDAAAIARGLQGAFASGRQSGSSASSRSTPREIWTRGIEH